MTVWFEKGRGWRYDFWLFGVRHTLPRALDTEREAKDAEAELRRSLRRQRVGLEPSTRAESPTFAETAGAYYEFAKEEKLVSDLDALDNTQFVILQFFGARPSDPKKVRAKAPYHNLRLQDPIDDATWILKFDEWMKRRGIAGPTKNRYRSACSRLYWFAMLPERRQASGITVNPFRGIRRDPEYARDVVLTTPQIRAIMAAAPYHLQLAIVIGTLAPKLRLSNILSLNWRTSFDAAMTMIKVPQHKTRRATKRAMVTPISAQLQRVLLEAKRLAPKQAPWVIYFRRRQAGRGGQTKLTYQPIGSITKALIEACRIAKVTYGRAHNGATFHTIRHSAATQLAALGVPEGLRKDVMGHLSIQTTQGYTHLNPVHEQAPLEQLSTELALEDLVVAPRHLAAKSHRPSHRTPGRKPAARKHK